MATRSSVATDAFTRADGPVGANYVQTNSNWGSVSIVSNAVTGGNRSSGGLDSPTAKWSGGTWTADQYAKATISGFAFNGAGDYISVIVRHDGGSNNSGTDTRSFYYACVLDDNSGSPANRTTEINKCVSGTRTNLSSVADSWANGDTLEIEAEGTTIRVFKTGTLLRSVTDSSIAGDSASRAGIGSSGNVIGDDLDVGNLVAAGGGIVPVLMAQYRQRWAA